MKRRKQQSLKKRLRNWFLKGFISEFMSSEEKTNERMTVRKI